MRSIAETEQGTDGPIAHTSSSGALVVG